MKDDPESIRQYLNPVGICCAAKQGDLVGVQAILQASSGLIYAEHPESVGRTRSQPLHFAIRGKSQPASGISQYRSLEALARKHGFWEIASLLG